VADCGRRLLTVRNEVETGRRVIAWNEADEGERRRLLGRSITDEAQLLDSTGDWRGVDGFAERISRYHTLAPGTRVVPSSGVDAFGNFMRYSWKIVDPQGHDVLEGLDVVERADDRRLRRILMFHGPLPPRATPNHDRPPARGAGAFSASRVLTGPRRRVGRRLATPPWHRTAGSGTRHAQD